jgi:dihydroneopterin aldolase
LEDRIRIEGIEFYAHHGVSAEERYVGHRYWVDLTVWGDLREAARTDSLSHTVSYSKLARRVVEIGQTERFALLERLADAIARAVLSEHERAQEVEVTVGKLHPPAKVVVERAAVILRRRREDLQV